jgi:predicted AlkP superfamily phosphohydrolase/phosphomutase
VPVSERGNMKALVIGLDGATFTVLTPLMQAGYMPNLKKALGRGVSGELISTVPPVTALAWPSFFTGKNPGKHGLMGWQGRLNENFERPWVSGNQVRGSKLWHLAGKAGLRVCVVNVPVTYPPEPLNGAMVTGLLTPGLEVDFTYPPELRTALLATVPDYRIDVDVQHRRRDTRSLSAIRRFLNEAVNATQARGKAIRWLLDREQPDLAVVVFEMPDRLQHVLWRNIERLPRSLDGTEGASIIRDKLLTCYQALDEEIGRLVDGFLPRGAYLVFLSDHGFGPWETNVHLSDWLARQGWLTYDRRRVGGWEVLRWIGSRVKRWLPGTLISRARQALPLLHTLDWSRTWAYAGLPTEYGIFLNVRGREPAGIVEPTGYETLRTEILEALRAWCDPRTGQPIMKAVYRREELYTGPFVTQAPDIVFELRRGYRVSDLTGRMDLLGDVSQEPWGFHEREGIFGMRGPGIETGVELKQASIQDMMPTLLYTLGLPVPDDLDGRVLLDIFTSAWRGDHPLHFCHTGEVDMGSKVAQPYSVAEEALVAERLKGLGYLE